MTNHGAKKPDLDECVERILALIYDLTKAEGVYPKIKIQSDINRVLKRVAELDQEVD